MLNVIPFPTSAFPKQRVLLFFHANFIEINGAPFILIFFEVSDNTRRFYGYAERRAPRTQRDDFAAIFAKRHVRFIPAEGDAKVFHGGLSCA